MVTAELELGHADEAIRILDEVFARYGPTPQWLVALDDANLLKGNREQAKLSWERAARIRIDEQAHKRLAEYYNEIGDKKQSTHHRVLALHAKGREAFQKTNSTTPKPPSASLSNLLPNRPIRGTTWVSVSAF